MADTTPTTPAADSTTPAVEATEPAPAATTTDPAPAATTTDPAPAATTTDPAPAATTTEPAPAANTTPAATTTDPAPAASTTPAATTTDPAAAASTTPAATTTDPAAAASTTPAATTTDPAAAASTTPAATTSDPAAASTTTPTPADAKEDVPKPACAVEAESMFAKFHEIGGTVAKFLTESVLNNGKSKKTVLGGTLADMIRAALAVTTSATEPSSCKDKVKGCAEPSTKDPNVFATDAESYKVFPDFLDNIIKSVQGLPENKSISQPKFDLGDPEKVKFDNLDPENKFNLMFVLWASRSVETFAFAPIITKEARAHLESKAVEAFTALPAALTGAYTKLAELGEDTKKALSDMGLTFDDSDEALKAAGFYKEWPECRGVFVSASKQLYVLVNDEDHLEIVSTVKGGDFSALHKNIVSAHQSLSGKLQFSRDTRLGFLTARPSNLGTALHAEAHITIPNLAGSEKLNATCAKFGLKASAVAGSAPDSGLYVVSIERRLGVTEVQALTDLYTGLKEIIKLETELQWRPQNVQEMFDHLVQAKACKSLLKKYLTKETFELLKGRKTSKGATLGECILSGTLLLESPVGLYAADSESYKCFAPLFDAVIKEANKLKATDVLAQPAANFGDVENLGFWDLDSDSSEIIFTKVAFSRSFKEFAFSPLLKKEDRALVEQKVTAALATLEGEAKGSYTALSALPADGKQELSQKGLLFDKTNRCLRFAGCYGDWPEGRGIFLNETKDLAVWVNQEDHVTVVSTQKGGDIASAYKKIVPVVKSVDEKLAFVRDERLGNLTTDPLLLGTAVRGTIRAKIPYFSQSKNFQWTLTTLNLTATAVAGTVPEEGIFDLSTKRSFGVTEIDVINDLYNGIKAVVVMEKTAALFRPKSWCTVL